jgi:sugar transferase (PEP-CTERM system associated)
MQVFNRQVSFRGLAVFGFETMLIAASILIAASFMSTRPVGFDLIWKIALATSLYELCFYYNDLYDLTLVDSRGELFIRILQAAGAGAIVLSILSLVVPSLMIGPGIFLTSLALTLVAVPAWRWMFNGVTRDAHLEERVLILGSGPTARTVAQLIRTRREFAYRLVGFITDDSSSLSVRSHDVLGGFDALGALVEHRRIDRIVVSLADRRGRLPIKDLLAAKMSGVRVEDATTTYERLTGKILIDDLKPSWLVFSDGFRVGRATRALKRTLDLALAIIGLILAAPLMVLTALAIRLESPGPILYWQERVGQHGRIFTLCKFRSMRTDAEHGTPVWATARDNRVTRVGRFIRLTRLDELPQLWSVLRGDMSFVGPRPERPYFVEQLAAAIPFYLERHVVKPGLTGWAQVKYQYGSSVEDAMEKLRYDLYYIKHMSLIFDLTIALDTVKVIVSAKGAK